MLNCTTLYYKLLNLSLSILVKIKTIPTDPIIKYGIDINRPLIYVLPFDSTFEVLTIRKQCLKYHLPDPLMRIEINGVLIPRIIYIQKKITTSSDFDLESIKLIRKIFNLYNSNPQPDIQILLISVMFGRAPKRKFCNNFISKFYNLNYIKNFFTILWYGRDSFISFSPKISLHYIATRYKDGIIAQTLARAAHIYFLRQHLIAIGPQFYQRKDFLDKLLQSEGIKKAIEEEACNKKISYKKAKKNAIKIIKEISANFSYETVRMADRIIRCLFSYIYQGINVNGSKNIRKLMQNHHNIVYLPCHRSHMDYLLISYVLYNCGIVPPHIAAGVNLSFWPVGQIFCRLGAFFIRRSFKRNKLYYAIFREYLGELFKRGYSVEYFIEGGRSRTGKLLPPKTGILSMTLQSILKGNIYSITFVPIYISYEHILEVDTYSKELLGLKKEKEGFIQMLRALFKLRNFGQCYVNFGKPLPLLTYLNKNVPAWQKSIRDIKSLQRPFWMIPIINDIAVHLMIRINEAVAANAINLCATVLLSSPHYSLTRQQLIEQLDCYMQLLRNVPYSLESTVPNTKSELLLEQAIKTEKFVKKQDVIILSYTQARLMGYYRNNIYHIFVIPSLIAAIIQRYHEISEIDLLQKVTIIYPMIKNEFFLRWNKSDLKLLLQDLCKELIRQKLIFLQDNSQLKPNVDNHFKLQLLANSIDETLQRFAITFAILNVNSIINRNELEEKSRNLYKIFSTLQGINTLEFFDKKFFSTLTLTLRDEGYISDMGNVNIKLTKSMWQTILVLIPKRVYLLIKRVVKEYL